MPVSTSYPVYIKNISDIMYVPKVNSSLNIDDISSPDEARNECLKKLVEKFHFWEGLSNGDSQINPDTIKQTLIAIADYLDLVFSDNQDVLAITRELLRRDTSRFYETIKDQNNQDTIDLIKSYLIHNLTLANLIENSTSDNKDEIYNKIISNLQIFPGRQQLINVTDQITGMVNRIITTDIDFVCIGGSVTRLNMANKALFQTPFFQQIISETQEGARLSFEKLVSQGNKVHVPDNIISLISLLKVSDSMFYSPDFSLSTHDIKDFLKNFKTKISENIDKELVKYYEKLLQAGSYSNLTNLVSDIDSELKIKLVISELFKEDKDNVDWDSIKHNDFKTKEEIIEILKKQLIESDPEIYYYAIDHSGDALDFLNGLNVYLDSHPYFLDFKKIDNAVKLLKTESSDTYYCEKIEAGLLFLYHLARDFQDSDSFFFLELLKQFEEQIPDVFDENGQKLEPLDAFYLSLPDKFKREVNNTQRIIDYIKAKKIEKYRRYFSNPNGITFQAYHEFMMQTTYRGVDFYNLNVCDLIADFNHINHLKIFIIESSYELVNSMIEGLIEYGKNKLLIALLDDDELFTDDQNISNILVIKILSEAVKKNELKLALSAIKRGKYLMQKFKGPTEDYKYFLYYSIYCKFDNIAIELLEEAEKQNKTFNPGTLKRCCIELINNNNFEILKIFLEKISSIDQSFLRRAMECNIDIALLLINKSDNVNGICFYLPDGITFLNYAIQEKKTAIALALIEKGADVNVINQINNKTSLQIAIETNQADIALALIEKGADVDRAIDGLPLANFVLKKISDSPKALEILKKIFEKNPNLMDQINSTYPDSHNLERNLLHLACYNNHPEIVEYLLKEIPADKRSDPNILDLRRCSPIMITCLAPISSSENKNKMVNLLIDAGANLKIKDFQDYDLCSYAIKIENSCEFLEKIYNARTSIEKIQHKLSGRDSYILKTATNLDNLECVKFLYEKIYSHGCFTFLSQWNSRNLDDIFDYAVKNNSVKCAQFFIDKGVNIKSTNRESILIDALDKFIRFDEIELAEQYNHDNIKEFKPYQMIKFLIEKDCNIDQSTNEFLNNFITQNPLPIDNPRDLETIGLKFKHDMINEFRGLINQRQPSPATASLQAQIVAVNGGGMGIQ
jgi:hypothetical protein